MPDEPPPVSRPNPDRPRAPRLPGTYAASFERDMDWRRGVNVLWLFFILAAVGEAVLAAFVVLRGNLYPAPLDLVRLCVGGALFLALWLGWGWLRWPLAAMNFFYGAWLIVWLLSYHAAEATANAAAGLPAPGYGIASIPQIALGLVYIIYAGYLAFSADVLDFLRHRREEGRGWVVAPLVLFVGLYLAALLSAQFFYLRWLEMERASESDFVTKSLETIAAQHWDVAIYENRADPEYLKTWFDGDRKRMFADLSKLGEFRHAEQPATAVIGTGLDATGSGFVVRGQVSLGQMDFAHGNSVFTITVAKTLFGPWQMQQFDAGNPRYDAAPASARP